MRVIQNENQVPIKIWTDEVEETALNQLNNLAKLPFIHKHVAVMPDVHAGCGSTIGSVIVTKSAIIPAAVGVDIGCGMIAAKLNISAHDLPDSLHNIRTAIETAVPHGRTDNGGLNDKGGWQGFQYGSYGPHISDRWVKYLYDDYILLNDKNPKLRGKFTQFPLNHLGTLGTGNHFIEICLDETDGVWVMLHSGSRGIGNRIGQYFIELAKQDMKKWFINLPDADLSYLVEGTTHFHDYVDAMHWAQKFAYMNREVMLNSVLAAISRVMGRPILADVEAINCHHNYASVENHFGENVWVTRKGAVRAREGELGIIPGSMGAKSYIVEGLGNPDSFMSCSHGAGRVMSRSAARKKYTLEDIANQTAGVECRKDIDVVDEIPSAYKDIDQVMENQKDLVRPLFTLKQIVCVKG